MRAGVSLFYRVSGSRVLLVLALFAAATSLGCTVAAIDRLPSDQRVEAAALETAAPEQGSEWESAVHILQAGDYQGAMDLFEAMVTEAEDQSLYRKALFGLAAARLAAAQTPADFDAALDAWKLWSAQAPMDLEDEDPRILTPFLERLEQSEEMRARIAEPLPSAPGPRKPDARKMAPAAKVDPKGLIRQKDKEIERLKSRLDSREREVKRLKHQIESLEEIHLKFQERKQETSNP